MLRLKNIVKNYESGGSVVEALRNVSIDFRDSDFVAILGHSGCGKTTLLNIIGGLDGYTDGDLIINGKSTKSFGDRDWDAYRNHSIGFVFQSYNLIPHQTVLANVELALTLSGVPRAERKKRATEALCRVGLHDQIHKKPNQLSGGQMQRVAIARALVNDPEIILADEPTGALDTETSVQVMDILREVAKDRLVIMVTHNPELAEQYATRTIRMVDGRIIDDSKPLTDEEYSSAAAREAEAEKQQKKKAKKPSMSFGTSFMLSLKNLFTKRGRTVLTSFAGSIGIIGIALILAVSQGMTVYIDMVQENTLSTYPLTIQSQTVDMSALMESFMGDGEDGEPHGNDAVYKDPIIGQLVNALSEVEANENDLKAFREYIEAQLADEESELSAAVNGLQYTYDIEFPIYTKNVDGEIIKSDTGELVADMLIDFMAQLAQSDSPLANMGPAQNGGSVSSEMMGTMLGLQMWEELLPGLDGDPVNDLIRDQYELVHGKWPEQKNEIILVLDRNNELDDLTLYALGLLEREEIDAIISAAANGEELVTDERSWTYEEICNMTFRTIMPYDCYQQIGESGVWMNVLEYDAGTVISNPVELLYEDAFELSVVGIIRPDENADVAMLNGSIGYTRALTEYVIDGAKNSPVVKAQLENPSIDVLTGLPFESNTGTMTKDEKKVAFSEYVDSLGTKGKAKVFLDIACLGAYDKQLDSATDMALAGFIVDADQNGDGGRGELISFISSTIASETDIDTSMVTSYLEKLTLEELTELIRPTVEENVKKQIAAGVESSLGLMGLATEEARAAALDAAIESYTVDEAARYYDEITEFSENTYEETLVTVGCVDLDTPHSINIFASTFEDRDVILAAIDKYNESVPEAQKISNTDYLGIMMSSITIIINAITYVLIAFVAISLVVSSIMIGVITLISVQERTKEIGILRAIGASKRNVSSMFNAETIIVGFAAGLLGVLITYVLCIPINMILYHFTGIANLRAILPIGAAVILVLISVVLTLLAGFIPSRSAAKKDPVVALRTE